MDPIHALIIDDNITNIEVLARFLSSTREVQITQIQNPLNLAQVLPDLEQIDIAFVDLEMPNLNGYEVLKILRNNGVEGYIIAYTVHTNEINTAREMGFDGFLSKPLRANTFAENLEKILSGESIWVVS